MFYVNVRVSGADQRDCVANMEYYLVLNFHPRGSLYDFLQDAQLTVQVRFTD